MSGTQAAFVAAFACAGLFVSGVATRSNSDTGTIERLLMVAVSTSPLLIILFIVLGETPSFAAATSTERHVGSGLNFDSSPSILSLISPNNASSLSSDLSADIVYLVLFIPARAASDGHELLLVGGSVPAGADM